MWYHLKAGRRKSMNIDSKICIVTAMDEGVQQYINNKINVNLCWNTREKCRLERLSTKLYCHNIVIKLLELSDEDHTIQNWTIRTINCASRLVAASMDCTTFVRSKQSMQFVRNTPLCNETTVASWLMKYLNKTKMVVYMRFSQNENNSLKQYTTWTWSVNKSNISSNYYNTQLVLRRKSIIKNW